MERYSTSRLKRYTWAKERVSEPNEKPCIQKRLKIWFSKILVNPVHLLAFSLILFSLPFLIYRPYLEGLDYSRTKDLVTLIVTGDVSIIAFTGVISSIILRHVFEGMKEPVGYTSIERPDESNLKNKKRRREIIRFIQYTLIALIGSIYFGLGAIITQVFPISIFFSMIFFFSGLLELLVLLVYSIEPEIE